MDQWKLVTVEEQRLQRVREVEINTAAFDRLADDLKPGTYTITATEDRITISGLYVEYVLVRGADGN